jgi:hypothetical protein
VSEPRVDRLALHRQHTEDAFVDPVERLTADGRNLSKHQDEPLQRLDANAVFKTLTKPTGSILGSADRSPAGASW